MKWLMSALIILLASNLYSQKPNIVFILADDLGYGDLGVYGHPYAETPNLDKLASQGTRFTRFYVNGTWCNPTCVGFMTGRHPFSFANRADAFGLQDRTTITELLKSAGYVTGHFGKWHIGPKDQMDNGTYGIDEIIVGGGATQNFPSRDAALFQDAINFIEKHSNKPFYVNVWGHITHYPVNPKPELAARFNDVVVDRKLFGPQLQAKFDLVENEMGGDINVGMRNYLGDVWGLDEQVGLLMDKLDELKIADRTIVVFSSDNGAAPVNIKSNGVDDIPSRNMLGYSGNLAGGKHDQWEGGVRMPFILRWPGQVPAGKLNNTSIFTGLDWLPTLSAIAGVNIDKSDYEGEDVTDIWKGSNRSRENPLFWNRSGPSILQGNWKLWIKGGETLLFDLSVDSTESNNIAADRPNLAKKLTETLNDWLATLPEEIIKNGGTPVNDPVSKPVIIGPADVPPNPLSVNRKIIKDNGIKVKSFLKNGILTLHLEGSGSRIGNPWAVNPLDGNSLVGTQLSGDGVETEVKIYNVSGNKIFSSRISSFPSVFDIRTIPTGVYQIQIKGYNQVLYKKFAQL